MTKKTSAASKLGRKEAMETKSTNALVDWLWFASLTTTALYVLYLLGLL